MKKEKQPTADIAKITSVVNGQLTEQYLLKLSNVEGSILLDQEQIDRILEKLTILKNSEEK